VRTGAMTAAACPRAAHHLRLAPLFL